MKEIGGYIELETYSLPMMHENAIALNCGRNCLAYLICANKIETIWLPRFLCETVAATCKKYNVEVKYYDITVEFLAKKVNIRNNEWIYLVNYYGQLSEEYLIKMREKYSRVIVDNAQAYFQKPIPGMNSLYSCRKFFGVSDGAFLYTDVKCDKNFPLDESYNRMNFLLGRYERLASDFYNEYVANNNRFVEEPIKRMSKLTYNLLHSIDYEKVKEHREENYCFLHNQLKSFNRLSLHQPCGPFMYPLYVNEGQSIRQKLLDRKIYIPILWPNVMASCDSDSLEYDLALNCLPLPIDQRYTRDDMKYLSDVIKRTINEY